MMMMMTKIGKEMVNNTKNKTKDKKNRNITMHKGNKEALINQIKTRNKEEIDIGIRKDRDRKDKRGVLKNSERKQAKNLKITEVINKITINRPKGKCKDENK